MLGVLARCAGRRQEGHSPQVAGRRGSSTAWYDLEEERRAGQPPVGGQGRGAQRTASGDSAARRGARAWPRGRKKDLLAAHHNGRTDRLPDGAVLHCMLAAAAAYSPVASLLIVSVAGPQVAAVASSLLTGRGKCSCWKF